MTRERRPSRGFVGELWEASGLAPQRSPANAIFFPELEPFHFPLRFDFKTCTH